MPADETEGRKPPRMVTFTDVARLVVELGYADNMTREGVRRISRTHPKWPLTEDDIQQVGNAKALPWAPVEKFFREEYQARGRGPDKQPRKPKPPTE